MHNIVFTLTKVIVHVAMHFAVSYDEVMMIDN
jgi:hypothetical protein